MPPPSAFRLPPSAFPWVSDQGDGTFRNPVLHADYSDPDVIRAGEDFYLTASSFNCAPGLPILHSRDLVNWRLINHALPRLPHPRYDEPQPGCGVWAPAFRQHGGMFWIVYPTPDEGLFVVSADDPAGAWSEPHRLLGGKGLIDPCPFWDDDGQAYVAYAYAGSRAGIRNKLHVRPASPDLREITGEGTIVAEIDESLPALEGPKFHKRNGFYYISAPSGGVAMGWQVIFRSRHIYGPYEEKIVLAQRGTDINGPHQGALVDTPGGEWWFLHFQDAGAYGRIVHLQPVRWEDDWPLIGVEQDADGVGKPTLHHRKPAVPDCAAGVPAMSDDFSGAQFGLQWQWHANPQECWHSLAARPGHLRLYPQFVLKGDFAKAGNLLLQKFPAPSFFAETELELSNEATGESGTRAGLLVMGLEHAALDVQRAADGAAMVRLIVNGETMSEHRLPGGTAVRLRVEVSEGGACRFGIRQKVEGRRLKAEGGVEVGQMEKDEFYRLGPVFSARPGRWIGAKVGVYCLSAEMLRLDGHADFAYFRVGGGEISD